MSNTDSGAIEVYFSPEQMAWLYRTFPVRVFGYGASKEEMLYYNAQQAVLQRIESAHKR